MGGKGYLLGETTKALFDPEEKHGPLCPQVKAFQEYHSRRFPSVGQETWLPEYLIPLSTLCTAADDAALLILS